jgi:uncharacterized membrane protein YhiD involved in acid resistance
MDALLNTTGAGAVSLPVLAADLLLSLAVACVIEWFYVRYGRSMSNRARFGQTLPILAVTTTLVISVVKSSVALSLGLVGALSIVRFRTAIKEPEELLYLFLAIAVGLGFGADQAVATVVAALIILAYIAARGVVRPRPPRANLYLDVTTPDNDEALHRIDDVLAAHAGGAALRRLDRHEASLQATYLIAAPTQEAVRALLADLRQSLPDCELSFVEQDGLLGA